MSASENRTSFYSGWLSRVVEEIAKMSIYVAGTFYYLGYHLDATFSNRHFPVVSISDALFGLGVIAAAFFLSQIVHWVLITRQRPAMVEQFSKDSEQYRKGLLDKYPEILSDDSERSRFLPRKQQGRE